MRQRSLKSFFMFNRIQSSDLYDTGAPIAKKGQKTKPGKSEKNTLKNKPENTTLRTETVFLSRSTRDIPIIFVCSDRVFLKQKLTKSSSCRRLRLAPVILHEMRTSPQ